MLAVSCGHHADVVPAAPVLYQVRIGYDADVGVCKEKLP